MDNKNDNKNSLSPGSSGGKKTEEGETLLTFSQALELVLLNKRIHKLEWENREFYGVLDNEILKIHKPDEKLYQWILSEADIAGNDYVLID